MLQSEKRDLTGALHIWAAFLGDTNPEVTHCPGSPAIVLTSLGPDPRCLGLGLLQYKCAQLSTDKTSLWEGRQPTASVQDGRTRGGAGEGNETAREGETFWFESG